MKVLSKYLIKITAQFLTWNIYKLIQVLCVSTLYSSSTSSKELSLGLIFLKSEAFSIPHN